jgi:hypothetical protein
MVSEPISLDSVEPDPAENQVIEPLPVTPESQPRWMSTTVALAGILGLIVMVILVRG